MDTPLRRRLTLTGLAFLLLALTAGATVFAMRAEPGFIRKWLPVWAQAPPPPPAENAIITVTPETVYQTMRGWEAVAYAAQDVSPNFATYAPAVFDQVVEAGIDRVRLALRAGVENTADSYGAWAAAGYPVSGTAYATWRATRYETINDNADPNVVNPSGFHFTEIDDTIDRVVNPLRSRLASKGESLYVNLNYTAFTAQTKSGRYLHNAPEEYAEFMSATFQHLQQKYRWVPDAIEVILEPDNVPQWRSGSLIGRVIVTAGRKLAAQGFTPHFIAPSTTCMDKAVDYFDQMIRVAEVKTYLKEIAYHRYCNASAANLQAIATRAERHGLSTSMLEWWSGGNTHQTLHEDIKLGRNSAWQQATLAGLNRPRGLGIANVDTSNPASPVVTMGSVTRYTSQYYKHVRQGAKRIGAASNAPALDPLAFVNRNGTYVVVVNALNAGSFAVRGLPAGTYGIRYTTAAETIRHPDQTITTGGNVTTSIPAAGVLTVYGLPSARAPRQP